MIDKEMLRKFSERQAERHKNHQAERDAATGEDMIFVIEPYEQVAMREWMVEHKKTCPLNFEKDGSPKEFPGGAIGGAITYKFTPTGIGMATSVSCHCGGSVNITDYDQW